MVAGTTAVGGLALAGVDSPFYPDHLKTRMCLLRPSEAEAGSRPHTG
jgi:hypothetical protein